MLRRNTAKKVVVGPPHAARPFGELGAGGVCGLASSSFFLGLLRKDRHWGDDLVVVGFSSLTRLTGEKLAAKLLRARVDIGEDLLLLLVGDTAGGVVSVGRGEGGVLTKRGA